MSFDCVEPIRAVSSSSTILTICCDGTRLSSTSLPTARSVTFATKSLTTEKFTSASRSAILTARIPSRTSFSVSLPLLLNFLRAADSFSESPENIYLPSFIIISTYRVFLRQAGYFRSPAHFLRLREAFPFRKISFSVRAFLRNRGAAFRRGRCCLSRPDGSFS